MFKIGDRVKTIKRGSRCRSNCGEPCIGERTTIESMRDGRVCLLFNVGGICSRFNEDDIELYGKVIKQYGIVKFMETTK
jgi:hypothetical protein